ncbi:uncharacterized protein LOC106667055 [Cimex lectularius]|uniref:Kynurenine formamidase n=1 Tax=Cimex lectularius TaxID=79782 RepID=A0A8I6RRQ6_CIMLE|nr:uncharacterized protein LOC106667055 [Cimex lectularius]
MISNVILMLTLLGILLPNSVDMFDYFDLGYGVDDSTPVFPGGKKFGYTKQFAEFNNGVFKSSNDFETGEHSGTHIDAPYHFNQNGMKVGEIPLERLITKAIFVNASNETAGNPKYTLPASKLTAWVEKHGPIPQNAVLLISFGWGSRYPDIQKHYGGSKVGNLSYPGLSKEAAEWIVNSKKFVGVGVDTPSVDIAGAEEVHVVLNGNNIYGLENVNLNQENYPCIFDVIVMPMKLMNGTGAPCRIIGRRDPHAEIC